MTQLPSNEGIIVNGRSFRASDVLQFAPVLYFHPGEQFLPCTIEYLLPFSSINDAANTVVKQKLVQADFVTYAGSNGSSPYHLQINDPQAYRGEAPDGERIRVPMYVDIKPRNDKTFVDLNFCFLYGFNGSQTANVRVPGCPFAADLENFADHQGDLEFLTVRVNYDLTTVLLVRYEKHGDSTFINANDVHFYEGTQHPMASVILHGHGTTPIPVGDVKVDEFEVDDSYSRCGCGVDFGDYSSDKGYIWRPFDLDAQKRDVGLNQLRFIGFDANQKSLNDQSWVAFQGRLGGHFNNEFERTVKVYGHPLNCCAWLYTSTIAWLVSKCGCLSSGYTSGDGPVGLATRSFAYQNDPAPPDS